MSRGDRRVAAVLVSVGIVAGALVAPATLMAQQPPQRPADPAQTAQPAPAMPAPPAQPPPAPPAGSDPAQAIPAPPPAPTVTDSRPQPDAHAKRRPRKPKRHRDRKAKHTNSAHEPDTGTGTAPLGGSLPSTRRVSVPNFFIDTFAVPPFLLPIYQAAGIEYGVRWEILAAINEIETDYGRNLNVSSAGAMGWMQFMPASWRQYGVDANRDGRKDPYNPVDAIFAAARYLKAAGAGKDLKAALFAYNHADWYVKSVLRRAQLLAALPADLVSALSGLAQGRPPVLGRTQIAARRGDSGRSSTLRIGTRPEARVVAVTDGEVIGTGRSARLGRFIRVRDGYGNRYTYGELAHVARRHPTVRPGTATPAVATAEQRPDPPPPLRPAAPNGALSAYDRGLFGDVAPRNVRYHWLRKGSRVAAGTILGHTGRGASAGAAARMRFEIRPAGRRAPRIDPRPIIAGWKLLAASQRQTGTAPSIGQVLLLGEHALARQVLDDRRIKIYRCGRDDIRAGHIDRRVLATLELLAMSGLSPTVSSLNCGHSRLTTTGNVSEHFTGDAVDISAINGIPIRGHQGPGSITETTVQRLLTLHGMVKPHQIISLMRFDGAGNTVAMADHADHIHVGFAPEGPPNSLAARSLDGVLDPREWLKLVDRLRRIGNPQVDVP